MDYKDYIMELKNKCNTFIREVELTGNDTAYTYNLLQDVFTSFERLKDFYDKSINPVDDKVKVVRSMDELKTYLEEKGWSIDECAIGSMKNIGWEISQYSPAGEDFSFTIEHNNDVLKAIENIKEFAYFFDVEEHVKMWIEARNNVDGVPDAFTLVEDANAIQEMLDELADGISYYEQKTIAESIAEAENRSGLSSSGEKIVKDNYDINM